MGGMSIMSANIKTLKINELTREHSILKQEIVKVSEKIDGEPITLIWDGASLSVETSIALIPKAINDIINAPNLFYNIKSIPDCRNLVIYGILFGGAIRGNEELYGNTTRFLVHDIAINNEFISVDLFVAVATYLGLDTVPFKILPAVFDTLQDECNSPSIVSEWYGIKSNKKAGIVVKPTTESTDEQGNRLIAKLEQSWVNNQKGNTNVTIPKQDSGAKEMPSLREKPQSHKNSNTKVRNVSRK